MNTALPFARSRSRRFAAWLLIACLCLHAGGAAANPGIIGRVESIFEGIARSLNLVGRKSEDIVAPRLNAAPAAPGAGVSGLVEHTREVRESYPVLRDATVSVANSFGRTRIDTWDSQVVRVVAQITAAAEAEALAADVAARTDVHVLHSETSVEIQTVLPDTRDLGRVPISVDYYITVPREAHVVAASVFGDLSVHGIGGTLTVDSRFGAVTLDAIAGPVAVRAQGPFDLAATGLRQGGAFELSDVKAVFSGVDGLLQVRSHLGTVELRSLGPHARVDAASDSGDIRLLLAEDDVPDLTATAVFGSIDSDVPVTRSTLGEAVYARSPHGESPQQIALHTSFGAIVVRREGRVPSQPAARERDGELIKQDPQEAVLRLPEGGMLAIDAAIGDVVVEGADENVVRISATRFVRLHDPGAAREAFEALSVVAREEDGRVIVETAAGAVLESLGCTSYRIDLRISVPRTSPVTVKAEKGRLRIAGLGAGVVVEQREGQLDVAHVKGPSRVRNARGDVRIRDCEGPVEADAAYGALHLSTVYGAIDASCREGRLVIDAPGGPVAARNRGGDIRVIALEGVGGPYHVETEDGGISIVLPPTADATLVATVENGMVYSGIPLTGATERNLHKFVGRMNGGEHQVTLIARGGDLNIN